MNPRDYIDRLEALAEQARQWLVDLLRHNLPAATIIYLCALALCVGLLVLYRRRVVRGGITRGWFGPWTLYYHTRPARWGPFWLTRRSIRSRRS